MTLLMRMDQLEQAGKELERRIEIKKKEKSEKKQEEGEEKEKINLTD